jgi:hypothetical protein
MVYACLVSCVGRYDNYGCRGQHLFTSLARYNFRKDIQGFLIYWGTLQPECHGAVAVGGVLVVRNLGPKFFGSNGGGYCVHRILQGKLPCSVWHHYELILEFCLGMDPYCNHQ